MTASYPDGGWSAHELLAFMQRLIQMWTHLDEARIPGPKLDRATEDDVVEEHRLVGGPAWLGDVVVRLG